jgi:hypothetical protein
VEADRELGMGLTEEEFKGVVKRIVPTRPEPKTKK